MVKKALTRINLIIFISIALAVVSLPEILAQQATTLLSTTSLSSILSVEELKARRTLIEGMVDIDAAVKTSALENIDQAITYRGLADINNKKTVELSQLLQAVPERLNRLKKESIKPLQPIQYTIADIQKKSGPSLEQIVRQNQAELTVAQTGLKEWSDRLASEKNTIKQLPEQLMQKSARLKEVQVTLDQLTNEPNPDLISRTRVLSLKAEQEKLASEIKIKEQQKSGHTLLLELFLAEQDTARRAVEHHEKLFQILQTEVQSRNQQEATQASADAQDAMQDVSLGSQLVQDQFDINVQLSKEIETIVTDQIRLTEKYEDYQSRLKDLEEEFETARKRVDLEVFTEIIGIALRTQRFNLPDVDQYSVDSNKNLVRISEISERQIQLERYAKELSTPESIIEMLIASFGVLSSAEKKSLESKFGELITKRIDMIIKLKSEYDNVINRINDIEFVKKKLINTSQDFGELLDRHLLWIPSSKPISIDYLQNLTVSLKWFFSHAYWNKVLKDTARSLRSSPVIWGFYLLIFMLLVFSRKWTIKNSKLSAKSIDQQRDDSFFLTIKVLGLTLLLSVCWPFLLILPAMGLSKLPGADPSTRAVIGGLIYAARILIFWALLYNICHPDGLARAHFQWPEPVRRTLRWNIAWFMPIDTTTGFFLGAMEVFPESELSDSLAIFAILIQTIALSVFFARTLRFKKGITAVLIEKKPKNLLTRLRYIWYPIIILLPLILLWLTISGYYYSSLELRSLVNHTISLGIGVVLLNALALRALKLARRKVIARKTVESEELHQKTISHGEKLETPMGTADPVIREPIVKMNEIDEHTRSILKLAIFIISMAGLWDIWESVFPAFGILQDVHFWSYNTMVDGAVKTVSITLANITMSVVIIFVTFVAVRNLPGLLEIILLSRLQIDPGARYAYATVCKYVITALGFFIALNSIGVRWSNLQWLVAALSVGLGFGLQEIVANFISGLIVLFERPFRIGDTVTVGGVHGTVTVIRIRATTILDWDRKELIVPNKEFITGQLINWSLSDQVLRVIVPVGIAYGSDTDLAEQLMMKAVKSNTKVLKSPEPKILFVSFGDNSLNFEARVFIKDIDDWVGMRHQLHRSIDKEFRKAGITIAFPQRDVHIDLNKPVDVRMVSPASPIPETAGQTVKPEKEPS